MWLMFAVFFGCDQGPLVLPTSAPPPPPGAAAPSSGDSIECTHDQGRCRKAKARLATIEEQLAGLDCADGGAANPEECAARRQQLEAERGRILTRWGSAEAPSEGGAGAAEEAEGEEMATPGFGGAEDERRPRRRPAPSGPDGGGDGMDIEISDE